MKKPKKVNNKSNKKIIDDNYYMQNKIAEQDALIKRLRLSLAEVENYDNIIKENEELKHQLEQSKKEIDRLKIDEGMISYITSLEVNNIIFKNRIEQLEAEHSELHQLRSEVLALRELSRKLEKELFKHD
ncbi:MAG: hypothetical protein ACI32H_02430 [Bacilli bacterium]